MKAKINIDLDEQKEGVSYEKGLEFEKEFSQFMKKELGWNKIRIGAHMQGKNNAKGTSIDIFAERLDYAGVKYQNLANKFLLYSIGFLIFGIIWFIQSWGNHGLWFITFSLLTALTVCIFKLLSETYNKQNAWVECKNLKSKVDINHISKMLREFNDYKLSKNDDHRFTHLYFASANGYVENALRMAMDNKITCYTKTPLGFEEVKYWDETK